MSKSTTSKRIIEVHQDLKHQAIIFEMELDRMPNKYIALAKEIDGDAYTESCFAFEFKYLMSANRYFVKSNNGMQAYYLDEEGNRHYMDYKIPKNVTDTATDQCHAHLKKIGVKRCRKSRVPAVQRKKAANITEIIIATCIYNPELFKVSRQRQVPGQLVLF